MKIHEPTENETEIGTFEGFGKTNISFEDGKFVLEFIAGGNRIIFRFGQDEFKALEYAIMISLKKWGK